MEKEQIEIVLSDDTQIEAKLNGNCYITNSELNSDILSEENLVNVTIDGQEYKNFHCDVFWKDGVETWFVIRQKTEAELEKEKLDAKIDFLMTMMGVE